MVFLTDLTPKHGAALACAVGHYDCLDYEATGMGVNALALHIIK